MESIVWNPYDADPREAASFGSALSLSHTNLTD